MRLPALVLAMVATALLLGGSQAQAAGIQTEGSQVWPGKLQVGFHPLGGQVSWNLNSVGGYKIVADVAGLIAQPGPVSLWLGGGINYTAGLYYCYTGFGVGLGTSCGHDIQFWAFVMVTLEKLITKIPLVPFVRAGLAGDVLVFSRLGGAFALRFGGGVHYWLLKNIGLGIETNFTIGPAIGGPWNGTTLYGTWDFGIGARFAF